MSQLWRKCSSCKQDINIGNKYYVCNVSTCNSKRTGYVFCSVPCFERHLPGARHKDAYAIEEVAKGVSPAISPEPKRRIINTAGKTPSSEKLSAASSNEILIVASKLKKYIQDRGDMNTAGSVMNVLSDKVRALCDNAIEEARSQGRKTVMDRDFK